MLGVLVAVVVVVVELCFAVVIEKFFFFFLIINNHHNSEPALNSDWSLNENAANATEQNYIYFILCASAFFFFFFFLFFQNEHIFTKNRLVCEQHLMPSKRKDFSGTLQGACHQVAGLYIRNESTRTKN